MSSDPHLTARHNHGDACIIGILGGVAALLAAILFRRWLSAELALAQGLGFFSSQPLSEPSTVLDWLSLLHSHRLIGLVKLNFFDLINYGMAVMMYLGVYGVVKAKGGVWARAAAVGILVGFAVSIASAQSLALLSLSDQYFQSATDLQRTGILGAGQYALVANNALVFGTGTFWAYILFYG